MSNVLVDSQYLSDIADSIRTKNGSADTYKPSEMATAISNISGGITPTGTKSISITENGTTTEDVANYASAQITVNVPTSSTNFGADNTNTLAEMFYALEHNNYSTGTVTLTDYFPANTESEFCDTGFADNVRGILIFCTDQPVSSSNSYDTYEALGFMGQASTAGADQGISSVSGFTKVRNTVFNTFLSGTYITPRVNGGKLYITPTRAASTYTFFHTGNTYRWIAWGYTS